MPIGDTNASRTSTTLPQRASRAMRRAERCAERGQVAEAIASIEQALQFGADAYTCYLRLARLYQTQGQWNEAMLAAEKAIVEHPESVLAREAVVALCMESRDYARAVDASKALLRLHPRHVPARDALGAAYMGLGDVESAIRVADDLIRIDPTEASHRFKRGLLSEHQGDIPSAVSEFERVIDMTSDVDLAESARNQLDILDAYQINDILTLAMDDWTFRGNLFLTPGATVTDRGYRLSELGLERLQDIVREDFSEHFPTVGLPTYH